MTADEIDVAPVLLEESILDRDYLDTGPTAVSLVVHDNDLAGLLQLAVAPSERRKGVATAIVQASLRWARLRGARQAWLAVEADNHAAIALYRKFGFRDVYRYLYRRAGE